MTKRIGVIFCVLCMAVHFFAVAVLAEDQMAGNAAKHKIVVVADLSGSMAELEKQYELQNALHLAIDLAPEASEIAIIGINSNVVVETPFCNPSAADDTELLIKAINTMPYGGNTNLVVGLERAAQLLDGEGRIILLADISEGGLVPDIKAEQWGQRAERLRARCIEMEVAVELILFREAPAGSLIAGEIENLSAQTGGDIYRVESSQMLQRSIEEIYFSSYHYFQTKFLQEIDTETETIIPITLPSAGADRVRIYIPEYAPQEQVRATYAGAFLEIGGTKNYSLLDFVHPEQNGISLIFPPQAGAQEATIYLLYLYQPQLDITIENRIQTDGNGKNHQVSYVSVGLQSAENEVISNLDSMLLELVLHTPSGKAEPVYPVCQPDGTYLITYHPKEFGNYKLSGNTVLSDHPISLRDAVFTIDELSVPSNYTALWVTLSLSGAVLLILLLIWFLRRRRKISPTAVSTGASTGFAFSGRLDFYVAALKADANYEIPPFTCYLTTIARCNTSLQEILNRSDIQYHFPGADKIEFRPGPDKTLLVKNIGSAGLLLRSAIVEKGKNGRMAFGEKLYFTASDGVSEIAIYYRNVKKHEQTYHSSIVTHQA